MRRRQNWNPGEDKLLMETVEDLTAQGINQETALKRAAELFPDRSDGSIKMHFYRLKRKEPVAESVEPARQEKDPLEEFLRYHRSVLQENHRLREELRQAEKTINRLTGLVNEITEQRVRYRVQDGEVVRLNKD